MCLYDQHLQIKFVIDNDHEMQNDHLLVHSDGTVEYSGNPNWIVYLVGRFKLPMELVARDRHTLRTGNIIVAHSRQACQRPVLSSAGMYAFLNMSYTSLSHLLGNSFLVGNGVRPDAPFTRTLPNLPTQAQSFEPLPILTHHLNLHPHLAIECPDIVSSLFNKLPIDTRNRALHAAIRELLAAQESQGSENANLFCTLVLSEPTLGWLAEHINQLETVHLVDAPTELQTVLCMLACPDPSLAEFLAEDILQSAPINFSVKTILDSLSPGILAQRIQSRLNHRRLIPDLFWRVLGAACSSIKTDLIDSLPEVKIFLDSTRNFY